MSDEVVIGKFGRPHGVRGEVRLYLYNPSSELFDAEELVLHVRGGDSLSVDSFRLGDKFAIVRLDGVSTREDAERLTNKEVFVPRDSLPAPDPDEFYLVDVIGFEVRAPKSAGDEPQLLGTVKGWIDIGPNDIMAVTGPDIKGRMLVPHLDHTVDRFDFDEGCVYLAPLDEWMPADEESE